MRQFLVLAVFAAVCILAECRGLARSSYAEDLSNCLNVDVDEYVDHVLEKAREELPDPIRLAPRSTFVDLTDGVLWGLSNITRRGKAEVHCKDDHTVTVKSKITTDELKGRYTWLKLKNDKVHHEGYVVFISNDFEAEVEVLIERIAGEVTHPKLQTFKINKFKNARVEMTGMGFFTWALGEMTTLMSGIFQRAIAGAVQGPLEEAIERHMREIVIE